MSGDDHGEAAAYALEALDLAERAAFERHLAGCPACVREVAAHRRLMPDVLAGAALAPAAELRQHILELTDAPLPPLDLARYDWDEVEPGIRMATLLDDPTRALRKALVWARPGARYPSHRHLGDEEILVLEGALTDGRAVYRPGDICRSRAGSVHSEQVVGDEDCVCFVVYHGAHERLAE